MQKKITLLLPLLLLVLSTVAQPDKRKQMEARRVAYLTEKLALTPEEAQVFWPVYNQRVEALHALRKERRSNRKEGKTIYESGDEQKLEAVLDKELVLRRKELELLETYHAKLKTVLPIKKLAKLYRAEEQFKREIMKHARQHPPGDHPKKH